MAHTNPDEESGESTLSVTPNDAARYIEGISAELAAMAHRCGFDFLAYLLDVAREEAAARAMETSDARSRRS